MGIAGRLRIGQHARTSPLKRLAEPLEFHGSFVVPPTTASADGHESGHDCAISAGGGEHVDQLAELAELHGQRALTDAEFAAAKARLRPLSGDPATTRARYRPGLRARFHAADQIDQPGLPRC
jgi:hypothetical protein